MISKKVKKDYDKIIKTLEEELVRKQKKIEELKEQNIILLKTAIKEQNKHRGSKSLSTALVRRDIFTTL